VVFQTKVAHLAFPYKKARLLGLPWMWSALVLLSILFVFVCIYLYFIVFILHILNMHSTLNYKDLYTQMIVDSSLRNLSEQSGLQSSSCAADGANAFSLAVSKNRYEFKPSKRSTNNL